MREGKLSAALVRALTYVKAPARLLAENARQTPTTRYGVMLVEIFTCERDMIAVWQSSEKKVCAVRLAGP